MAYYVVVLLVALVSLTFLTLLERKVMGSHHYRVGPNLNGPEGLIQPLLDALKLISHSPTVPHTHSSVLFWACPLGVLVLSLMAWVRVPMLPEILSSSVLIWSYFIVTRASVYLHLGLGWGSNSVYALLGGLRCVAQTISYEVVMVFVVVGLIVLYSTMRAWQIVSHQGNVPCVRVLP